VSHNKSSGERNWEINIGAPSSVAAKMMLRRPATRALARSARVNGIKLPPQRR